MIRKVSVVASVITLGGVMAPIPLAGVGPTVTVKNTLGIARPSETITLSACLLYTSDAADE